MTCIKLRNALVKGLKKEQSAANIQTACKQ